MVEVLVLLQLTRGLFQGLEVVRRTSAMMRRDDDSGTAAERTVMLEGLPAWCSNHAHMGELRLHSVVASCHTLKLAWGLEGFAFDAPDGFEAKPKPVKTHAAEVLYKNGKREIGVVVDRVRIEQLSDFGTPAFVGDKVVASERERDGVTAAELSKATELVVDGQTYYELAYSNESSRGNNNFLSRVAVRGGRLYVMTLKARIDDAGALPELRQVAESFRVSGL